MVFSSLSASNQPNETLSANDYEGLRTCEGVLELFRQLPDSVWPGYNLAEIPFLYYMPDRWALLVNYSTNTNGFGEYPKDWPDLRANTLYHGGKYKDFGGQLAFNILIDTVKVAAVPIWEKTTVELFGFIIHECFHQYQYNSSWETHWEREEKYPIQDSENTALAYLEVRLLMDALQMAEVGNQKVCREYLEQFVAVRNLRWSRVDSSVIRYELGKETMEGTAKYVELKSISLVNDLDYESSLSGLTSPLLEDFTFFSMPELLLESFEEHLTGNSVSPEDMPRNRIYSVGSAQGFLLDYLMVDWKGKVQQAGPEFSFVSLLQDCLGVVEGRYESLLKKAKSYYGYEEITNSTRRLIKEYTDGFEEQLRSFESQPGYRIEIELNSNGVRRSRSSSAKKWVVDSGTRELRNHFNIYSIESKDLLLQVQDVGLCEQNDWDVSNKRVMFFVPEITSVTLDGELIELTEDFLYQFENIEILGEKLEFIYSKAGTVALSEGCVKISVVE
jgi:hypothetical protein